MGLFINFKKKLKGIIMKLQEQKCVPCHSGMPSLSKQQAREMLNEIPDWTLNDNSIERMFAFKDFKDSIDFVNKVAEIANEQDHHPDIHIYYNKVRIELTTHKIKGLSENDFILAAKINSINVAGGR
jgi:4a-hydroxytetrahydrobiopterin dehydratase